METTVKNILDELMNCYPKLESCQNDIMAAFTLLSDCYHAGHKVLLCGNGGSASDCEHIVGELMKGFREIRPVPSEFAQKISKVFADDSVYLIKHLQGALPAISLVSHTSLNSAFINDVDSDMSFAQQVYGYGKPGDVLIGISTSGNSKNVVNAFKIAGVMGLKTIALTGKLDSLSSKFSDVSIKVPETETYKVQEYHLPVYHALCAMIEAEFFSI
jgi:D-sedoheptulose 7-phosphate isomerase